MAPPEPLFLPQRPMRKGKGPSHFLLYPFPLFLEKGFPSAAPGALVHRPESSHGSPFAPGEPAGGRRPSPPAAGKPLSGLPSVRVFIWKTENVEWKT